MHSSSFISLVPMSDEVAEHTKRQDLNVVFVDRRAPVRRRGRSWQSLAVLVAMTTFLAGFWTLVAYGVIYLVT